MFGSTWYVIIITQFLINQRSMNMNYLPKLSISVFKTLIFFVFIRLLVPVANAQTADTTVAGGSVVNWNAMISTDMNDYPPGATVIITGTGYKPGETVVVRVTHN